MTSLPKNDKMNPREPERRRITLIAPPQFYISCAQISVSGGGSTTPSITAKIPGAFKDTDPGYTANVSTHTRPHCLTPIAYHREAFPS